MEKALDRASAAALYAWEQTERDMASAPGKEFTGDEADAERAYLSALPLLDTAEDIRVNIAAAARGRGEGWLSAPTAKALLYAAQTALSVWRISVAPANENPPDSPRGRGFLAHAEDNQDGKNPAQSTP